MQVRLKSPKPESPESVISCAPSDTANLRISTKPRVMSAALALSPYPAPMATPQAIATTFFKAPPSSAPTTSVVLYILRVFVERLACNLLPSSEFLQPIVRAVGRPFAMSSAKLGPVRTATIEFGKKFLTIEVGPSLVSKSMPLQQATSLLLAISTSNRDKSAVNCCMGTVRQIMSEDSASLRLSVIFNSLGTGTSGR